MFGCSRDFIIINIFFFLIQPVFVFDRGFFLLVRLIETSIRNFSTIFPPHYSNSSYHILFYFICVNCFSLNIDFQQKSLLFYFWSFNDIKVRRNLRTKMIEVRNFRSSWDAISSPQNPPLTPSQYSVHHLLPEEVGYQGWICHRAQIIRSHYQLSQVLIIRHLQCLWITWNHAWV